MFGQEDELSGAVFDALDIGLILLDSDRRMVAWNAWLEASSGISFQQMLGKRIEVVEADDQGNPQVGVAAGEKVAGDPAVMGAV